MKVSLKIILLLCLALACRRTDAQTFSVSTDILGYARLGTMSIDASYAVARRWSLVAGARYNPFTFRKGDPDRQFQNRQQSYAVGMRLWPWHTWSALPWKPTPSPRPSASWIILWPSSSACPTRPAVSSCLTEACIVPAAGPEPSARNHSPRKRLCGNVQAFTFCGKEGGRHRRCG